MPLFKLFKRWMVWSELLTVIFLLSDFLQNILMVCLMLSQGCDRLNGQWIDKGVLS